MEVFVPFDEGKHYRVQWYFHLIISIFGLIFNSIAVQCYFMTPYYFNFRLRSTVGLVLSCVIFFSYQIIKTSNNLLHNKFVGGDYGCKVDAAINSTLFLCAILVTILLSETLRKDFTVNPTNNKEIIMKIFVYGSFCGMIRLLSVSLPGSSYYLDPSGMWCFLDFHSIVSIVVFIFFGLFIPFIYLMRNLRIANVAVKNAQDILKAEGNLSQAKVQQVRVLKSINFALIAFIFIESPIISYVLIKLITGKNGPIYLDLIATNIHFIYFASVPIQTFFMLYDFRMTFWILYGPFIDQIKIVLFQKSATINIDNISQLEENSNINHNWKFWLENKKLKEIFFHFSVQCYVSENIMFYEDILNYNKNGNHLQKLIVNNNINNNNNKMSDIEIQLWCQMYEEACRIYKLYIKIPTAPLEINIPATVREDIYHIFRFHNKHGHVVTDEIPIFPDISNLKSNDALFVIKPYLLAFDTALATIAEAIDRDIFPRFKNNKAFNAAVTEFIDNLN